jgi:hypothetical protein
MPRRKRPFVRESAVRDARLIVIATEDSEATPTYFKTLVSPDFYQSSKVHVELLKRKGTSSAPEHILAQIEQWLATYQIGADDEFWLVIDVDQWGDAKLSQIAQRCNQKEIHLAVSNPAVELWFLLHLTDLDRYDATTRQKLFENKKNGARRTPLEQAILDITGQYNKSNLDANRYIPHVEDAIERAVALDVSPTDRWPQQLGTYVYRLARSIIDSAPYGSKKL